MASNSQKPSELESILGGVQSRMAERQQAIQTGKIAAEENADKQICQGLQNAANACPPTSPAAKQGFQNSANKYRTSTSRAERDNLVLHIAKSVLIKKGIAAILIGAGTLTIAGLAAPGVMDAVDGTEYIGHEIDNGDGTHQFTYDSNGNGWDDSQVTVDNQTGITTSTEPDTLGLDDIAKNVWELATSFF